MCYTNKKRRYTIMLRKRKNGDTTIWLIIITFNLSTI